MSGSCTNVRFGNQHVNFETTLPENFNADPLTKLVSDQITQDPSTTIPDLLTRQLSTSEDSTTDHDVIKNRSMEKVKIFVQSKLEIDKTEIDEGIQKALRSIMAGMRKLAETVEYAKMLVETVFLQSDEEAIETIERLSDEEKKILIEDSLALGSDSEHLIAMDALRFAAISKRFDLLRYLFQMAREKGFDTEDRDMFGWNLAHLIALHSKGEFPLMDIPEVVAMLNNPNNTGATPLDFVDWLSEPSPVLVPVFGREKESMPPFQLHEMIGHYYWNRPRFSPGALLRFDYESPVFDIGGYISTLLVPKISDYIDGLRGASCKLQIRKMNGRDVPKQFQGQWECVASQDLVEGEIIALYSGTVIHNKWGNSSIKLRDKAFKLCKNFVVDADQGGGSLAEFINHGFPNCASIECLYKGFPLLAILSLEKIKAGTVLYMSYGSNYFIEAECMELNIKAKMEFLNSTKCLRNISKFAFSQDGTICFFADQGKTYAKKLKEPATFVEAIEGCSNRVKLAFLGSYCAPFLKKILDLKTFYWLMDDIMKKEVSYSTNLG